MSDLPETINDVIKEIKRSMGAPNMNLLVDDLEHIDKLYNDKLKATEKELYDSRALQDLSCSGDCMNKCLNYAGCKTDLDHFENKCKELEKELKNKDAVIADLQRLSERALLCLSEHWDDLTDENGYGYTSLESDLKKASTGKEYKDLSKMTNMLIKKNQEQEAVIASMGEVEHQLRIMLCLASSTLPYTDDGELQDNSVNPCIDYLRDSPTEIRNKKAERLSQLSKLKEKKDGF